ncbi:type II toxin-antitoxin system prevent-host-death family antitoxin [Methylobacterium indicum]|uniref:Uncharacterized protein n=1 Tax=Methylobacterium indicum TaxID=1775910 RepID=A0A8H8WQX7_9HYPH|nr:type II toxin-antitoxin system prevent-host-death family antitoxin [Methylobacterium indicum]BCM82720.1 hypothetical protein mvi_11810 [Methylobacterium indicum]
MTKAHDDAAAEPRAISLDAAAHREAVADIERRVPAPRSRTPFKFGLLRGRLGDGPDFFSPLPDEDLALWEG